MSSSANIRNFVVAGHAGSGKTALCDLMLYKAGAVERLGSVDQKSSVSDYTAEEQERRASLFASVMNCSWKDHRLFFIDTPGYGEFVGEMLSSMRAADSVLVLLDGVDGPQVGTARAWKFTRLRGVPRFALINRLDRERADFRRVLEAMRRNHGKNVVLPLTWPVGSEAQFSRVIDVLHETDVPPEIAAEVAENREMLMDAIAETDETLMERYLEGETLKPEEVAAGLLAAVQSCRIIPVFAGSVAKDIGITEMMDYMTRIFPNPLDKKTAPLADGGRMPVADDGPGVALVFKAVSDPFAGHLAFLKVISGKFSADSEVFNLSRASRERIGQLLLVNGRSTMPIREALPGMLCAVAKLKDTHIGDTLSTAGDLPLIKGIDYPAPVMSYAIAAVKAGDDEKMSSGLLKIAECDPTLNFHRNDETGEQLLSGMGDQHLNIALKRLKEQYKVEVAATTPKIAYHETVTGSGEALYRHKKQTGGAGQFAEVQLRIAASPEGYEFSNDVVGGNIPKNFIPAVEKGVQEMMARGPLVGCPVENVRVSVFDGKYHPVDSNEMAFKIAGRMAFREAMQQAHPVLLEPVMAVQIHIPEEYMGDITGDLNHKRGRIMGMSAEDGVQVIQAEVPEAEMCRYATELRSITQGRGSFEMKLARYEPVPPPLAAEVIARYQAENTESA